MENRRGRPKKEDGKTEHFLLKMTREDRDNLDYMSFMTGESKSELLRKALKTYYNLVSHRF